MSTEHEDPLVRPLDEPASSPGVYDDAEAEPGAEVAEPGSTEPVMSAEPAAADTAPANLAAQPGPRHPHSPNMLPARNRRSVLESFVVRLIATCGVVAIGVAIAAIMVSNKSQGWIVGLVVSIVSVILAAILWSSRQL